MEERGGEDGGRVEDEKLPVQPMEQKRASVADLQDRPRACTDFLCLIVFFAVLLLGVFVGIFAFVYGKPYMLTNGYDSFGNFCGMKNDESLEEPAFAGMSGLDMTDRKYVLFFDLDNMEDSLRLCVEECPRTTIGTLEELKNYEVTNGFSLCRYGVDLQATMENETFLAGRFGPCPKLPIPASVPILNRCVPTKSSTTNKSLYNVYAFLNSADCLSQTLSDIYAGWAVLVILSFFTVALTVMVLILLHCLDTWFPWIMLVGVGLVSIVATGLLWWSYNDLKNRLDETSPDMVLAEEVSNEDALLIFASLGTIFSLGIGVIIIVVFRRIKQISEILAEAVACLKDLGPVLFLLPCGTLVTLGLHFLLWTFVMLCLATANEPRVHTVFSEIDGVPENSSLLAASDGLTSSKHVGILKEMTMIEYTSWTWVHHFWWLLVIIFVWVSEFLLAWQQITVSGAVCRWFFHRTEREYYSPCAFVFKSWWTVFKYHLGSIALGSFLITVFKLPRVVVGLLRRLIDRGSDNCLLRCFVRALDSCCQCVESFLNYVSHNSYAIIAMEGIDFCPAARLAFDIIAGNALDVVGALKVFGGTTLFFAKVLVTAAVGIVALLLLKARDTHSVYATPLILVCVFAYFIAHCVISVYEIVIDTLILCFCEDYAMNKGWVVEDGSNRQSRAKSGGEYACPHRLFNLMTLGTRGPPEPGYQTKSSIKRRKKKSKDGSADLGDQEEAMELKPKSAASVV